MDTFKSMSDLVADAQDLLLTIGESHGPEVQLLKKKVETSIEDVRQQARRQIKSGAAGTRKSMAPLAAIVPRNPAITLAFGVGIALAAAYWLLAREADG